VLGAGEERGKFVFVSMCGAIGISYHKWSLQISTFYLSTKDYKVLGTTSLGTQAFQMQ
jgi:hypothetical protein